MVNIEYNEAAKQGVSGPLPRLTKTAVRVLTMADGSLSAEVRHAQSTTEIWKPVPSEPGVLASSWGRVLLPPRYAPMSNGGYRAYMPKPRYGQISRSQVGAAHSYRIVMVYRSDTAAQQAPRKVHQLVCEAFHGPKPFDRAVVIHIDEDAHNNRPENLKWGTQKENMSAVGFREYCRNRMGNRSPTAKARAKKV